MKILVQLLFIVFVMIVPALSHSADGSYFVTQTGSGSGNGSLKEPYSVTQFNDLTGNYGGKIFYFSGEINSELKPRISGSIGKPVVLDGYKAGDCQTCDGTWPGACDGNTAVIDRNGGSYGIRLSSANEHIVIQDFEITDTVIGVAGWNDYENITVKRCYFHDSPNQNGSRAVYFTYTDGAGSNITIGGSECNGIIAKDIGVDTGCADIEIYGGYSDHASDIVISYNHLYATRTDRGIDGITLIRTEKFLIEYNKIHDHNDSVGGGDAENSIDIKGGCSNGIIRFNEMYNQLSTTEPALIIQTGDGLGQATHDIFIYGNMVRDNEFGIVAAYPRYINSTAQGPIYNIYIWSNVVVNNKISGISMFKDSGADNYDKIYIYNNTIVGNGYDHVNMYGNAVKINSEATGLKSANLSEITEYEVKNNIISNNRPEKTDSRQAYFSDISKISLDGNQYYHPNDSAIIYNGSTDRNPKIYDANGEISDPGLKADYTLKASSPCSNLVGTVGTVNIQGTAYVMNWKTALHPSTDFTKVLSGNSAIKTVERPETGMWDKGAYYLSDNFLKAPLGIIVVGSNQ